MIRLLVLLLSLGEFSLLFAQFEPANEVQVAAIPSISFVSSSNTFLYNYQVTSSMTSIQMVKKIDISVGDKSVDEGGTITQVLKPSNIVTWTGIALFSSNIGANIVSWFPTDPTHRSVDDLYRPPSEALAPGQSLVGLGMASSFLPGPSTFYAQGWVKPISQGDLIDHINQQLGTNYSSTDEIPRKVLKQTYPPMRSIKDNSFSGVTVAPMQSPVGLTPSDLSDRLVSLKHQSASLGWIFGPGVDGIVNSLDAKLSAAKDSVASGDNRAAADQLNAFINELDAQRGKHLNDNAYYLLKTNAQFIIGKLQ